MTSYDEKTEDCEAARADPFGFYDGMAVWHSGREYVLTAPAVTLEGDQALDICKPAQGNLF